MADEEVQEVQEVQEETRPTEKSLEDATPMEIKAALWEIGQQQQALQQRSELFLSVLKQKMEKKNAPNTDS